MAGTLRAQFIYRDNAISYPLTAAYAESVQDVKKSLDLGRLATDVIVGIVGKAAGSVVDSIVAMTQPETKILETTVPLDGFYKQNGETAINGGFLVFHNGIDVEGTDASLMAVLKVIVAKDGTAFRFEVMKWGYERFLIQDEGFIPHDNAHDVALKIEFLTPGSQGLGTRAAFSEHIFHNVASGSLDSLFLQGQALPWIAAPARGNMLNNTAELTSPLNIQISLLETSEPGLISKWIQDIAKENKTNITKLAQDSTQRVIDPAFAATEGIKFIDAGKTAYDDYYKIWVDLKKHYDTNPADLNTDLGKTWQAEFNIKSQILSAKKIIAIGAFDLAGLPWPGDLSRLTS